MDDQNSKDLIPPHTSGEEEVGTPAKEKENSTVTNLGVGAGPNGNNTWFCCC